MTQKRPNILYIMSDQHAAGVMGCANDPAADTPNLDRLAQSGTRFTRAYCPSPLCLPSRMSMLTGQQPHEQDCWTNDDILDSARPTWLNGLGAAGYRPVLAGRMHSLGPDQLRGYTQRLVGDHSPSWPGVTRKTLGPLAKTSGPFAESIIRSGAGQSSYQVMDADVLEAAVTYLTTHAESGTSDPFCLTASFMLPHPPYVADEVDFDAVKDRVLPPKYPEPPQNEHPWITKWRMAKSLDAIALEDVHRARCGYYGLVRQLDRFVGTLLATLNEIGASENTLVIYVSDHGDHLGERGLFWKHTFFEDSVKVPLIMAWSGTIPAGQTIVEPVETGGLGNTILGLVGADLLPNATMKPFVDKILPELKDQNTVTAQPIFIEYCTDDMPAWAEGFAVQQRAVILGDHKFVYIHGYPDQLYDLKKDPDELCNLAEDASSAEIANKMRALIFKDWDPDDVAAKIAKRRADKVILKAWAENARPEEPYRWNLEPSQNFLT